MAIPIKLHIAVIIGSIRNGRFSEKPANWIYETARKRDGIEAELLDLREYPLPFFGDENSRIDDESTNSKNVELKWSEDINKADAFIIVTPEYNHSFPGVLKNAMDYLNAEWNNKPVGFVSYGSANGARAIEQLRLVAIELSMAPIRMSIHIPQFWSITDDKGNLKTETVINPRGFTLQQLGEKFLDQLMWWAKALKIARENK